MQLRRHHAAAVVAQNMEDWTTEAAVTGKGGLLWAWMWCVGGLVWIHLNTPLQTDGRNYHQFVWSSKLVGYETVQARHTLHGGVHYLDLRADLGCLLSFHTPFKLKARERDFHQVVYPLIFVWARRREEMITYGPEEREREGSGLSTDFLLTLPKQRKAIGI